MVAASFSLLIGRSVRDIVLIGTGRRLVIDFRHQLRRECPKIVNSSIFFKKHKNYVKTPWLVKSLACDLASFTLHNLIGAIGARTTFLMCAVSYDINTWATESGFSGPPFPKKKTETNEVTA